MAGRGACPWRRSPPRRQVPRGPGHAPPCRGSSAEASCRIRQIATFGQSGRTAVHLCRCRRRRHGPDHRWRWFQQKPCCCGRPERQVLAAERLGVLLHRHGFARERRFVHLQIDRLDQPSVGRHLVARMQQNQVAWHELARRICGSPDRRGSPLRWVRPFAAVLRLRVPLGTPARSPAPQRTARSLRWRWPRRRVRQTQRSRSRSVG